MKKLFLALLLLSFSFAQGKNMGGMPQMFQSVAPNEATLLQAGDAKNYCPACGMDLIKHYKNSFAVKLNTGENRQYCSLHCFVDENEFGYLKNKQDLIKEILVVDLMSLKFIDATKAHFVVGSKIKGSMSGVSKYAFKEAADAKAFAKENGGKVMSYKNAYKVALKDFENDLEMIRSNRSKMMYKVGEEMYENSCNKEQLAKIHFHTVGELKAAINISAVCGKNLSDPQLQAIALYYYDIKLAKSKKLSIDVPKDAKCPVCGMFVAKHPKWAAKITLNDGSEFYYDGVKDLFKHLLYTLDPKSIKEILATDYYSQNAIDLMSAFLVIGSDAYGPMGHELIPFENEKTAKEFLRDHHGTKVLNFGQVDKKIVESLDN